jgi:hypothetical protein
MKKLWICALVMAACGPTKEKEKEPASKPLEPPPIETVGTDMVFSFETADIPKGFVLDTLVEEDTVKKVFFIMYWFKAMDDSLSDYNQSMTTVFEQEVQRELTYYDVPANEYESSDNEFGPMRIVVGDRYISTAFIRDSYTNGGNHHNYDHYSLNFDLRTRKLLWFNREFRLKTRKDSLNFRALVGRHLERDPQDLSGCCNDTIDFFLAGDTVYFGPYLSWAEGLQTSAIVVDSLKPFLNKKESLHRHLERPDRGSK